MKRKLIQAGSSLAVTLPAETVKEFGLRKGDEVEVTVHPQSGVVTIRPGAREYDDGEVSRRFSKVAEGIMEHYADAFEELAK